MKYKLTYLLFLIQTALIGQTIPRVPDAYLLKCLDDTRPIACPEEGRDFYGQDANYSFFPPDFQLDGMDVVKDNNTGLSWQRVFTRMAFNDYTDFLSKTQGYLDEVNRSGSLGGYADWRIPNLKEILSIADMNGDVKQDIPYIDLDYFDFEYPSLNNNLNEPPGTRKIDAQYISSTKYVALVNNRDEGFMSFNFADGHVKTYRYNGRTADTSGFYVRLVRGDSGYGENEFEDNGDGTITDKKHGLMWQKSDDGVARNWEEALEYCEALNLGGHNDWHLPDAKELNSILDLTRNDPAIRTDVFEVGDVNAWYWTSTSYLDRPEYAVYICFGKATNIRGVDTHGSGAMRGDPKSGNPSDYPNGSGPQMDEVRINNLVRAVRVMNPMTSIDESLNDKTKIRISPNPAIGSFYLDGFESVDLVKAKDFALDLFDVNGEHIPEEEYSYRLENNRLRVIASYNGLLYVRLILKDNIYSLKVIVIQDGR